MRPHGEPETVKPGDSILAPHRHTFVQALSTSSTHEKASELAGSSSGSDWEMASITLLLPKDLAELNGNLQCAQSCNGNPAVQVQRSNCWLSKSEQYLPQESYQGVPYGAIRKGSQRKSYRPRLLPEFSRAQETALDGKQQLLHMHQQKVSLQTCHLVEIGYGVDPGKRPRV